MSQDVLKNILNNIELMEKLSEMKNSNDMCDELKSYGIETNENTMDMILSVADDIENGKLDDRALDLISGGVSLPKNLGKRAAALSLALGLVATGIGGNVSAAPDDDGVGSRRSSSWTPPPPTPGETAIDEALKYAGYTMKVVIPVVGISVVIKNASDILAHLKNFCAKRSNSVKSLFSKLTSKKMDVKVYKTVLNKIEKRLRAELVGQDEAIDRIIKIMTGYFEAILEAKQLNKKFEKGLVLYLTGVPGTGKSTVMKIIEEEMGLKSFVGRMSDAVDDKGNNANSVASRLLKPIMHDDGKVKYIEDTPLARCLKVGVPTLYCLDEVDKMRVLDSALQKRDLRNEDGKIAGSSVDEMLRNFGDTGQINGVNAAGSILIATSNETEEQFKGLESSLYNRYKQCSVRFKDFNKDDYKELMKRQVISINQSYTKQFNCTVEWDQSALDHYSNKLLKDHGSARDVNALADRARALLRSYRDELNAKKTTFKNLKLKIFYDGNQLKVKS